MTPHSSTRRDRFVTLTGPVMTVKTDFGYVRSPMASGEVVGDRLVPTPIEVDLPGADGQPALFMRIEVIEGVPRCTEVTVRSTDGGREVRSKDLRAILEEGLDSWVEVFVSLCSAEITERTGEHLAAVHRSGEEAVRKGMRTIRDVRKGSRRPMTGERRQRVADVYNAQESGGIEAVEAAFAVSRSTAVRYIRAARDAGLIESRKS